MNASTMKRIVRKIDKLIGSIMISKEANEDRNEVMRRIKFE